MAPRDNGAARALMGCKAALEVDRGMDWGVSRRGVLTRMVAAGPALLAACGLPASSREQPAVTWTGTQEIELWVTNYPPVVEAYKQLIQRFHAENPRVRIQGGEGVAKNGVPDTLIPAVSGGT